MRWLQGISGPAVLAALVLLVPTTASAQKLPAAKPAEFNSADGVELKGLFYPSAQGKAGPTVLLLHAFGENCQKAEYVGLAHKLQKAGYSVLTFDFRGHGDSTKVKPGVPNPQNPVLAVKGFWDETANQQGVKGLTPNKPRPTEIEYKQFSPMYHRILVNDIAAAKSYLDQLNDAGECNTGALILIGARDGATLGAIWMNSEWHRYKFLPPQPGLPNGAPDLQNPEGQNIVCAVWLSISNNLAAVKKNGEKVNVPATLNIPAKQRMVPMAFFYGEGDSAGKQVAEMSEKLLKGNNKKDYQFTGALQLKGAAGASGSSLLSKSLPTEQEIVTYLGNALEGKTWPVKNRVNNKDSYLWRVAVNGMVQTGPARVAGRENIQFATYTHFIVRQQ